MEVQAAKRGKGKSMFRESGPMGNPAAGMQMMTPPTPEVDPAVEEFVIFVRIAPSAFQNISAKDAMSMPRGWVPLSILKGGQASDLLVNACRNKWGRMLYQQTLIKNLANSIYQERKELERQIKSQMPPFAKISGKQMEFGFKIRDKTQPKEWFKPTADLIPFPSEAAAKGNVLDAAKRFFSPENFAKALPVSSSSGSSPSPTQSSTDSI